MVILAEEKTPPVHIPEGVSYEYAEMLATEKDQSTLAKQQLVDARTTQCNVQITQKIYEYWNATGKVYKSGPKKGQPCGGGPLFKWAAWVNYYATENKHPTSADTTEVNRCQVQYNEASSRAQSSESQEDGATQASQAQANSDASNLQMKAQMVSAIMSIITTLSGMLGRIIG